MKENKNIKMITIISTVLLVLISIVGISYAYFTIQVSGNEEASSITITAANLKLTYTDTLVMRGDKVYPGWYKTKTISVYNNGTDTVYYKILWRDLLNEVGNDELVLSATCTSLPDGTCEGIEETIIPTKTTEDHNIDIKDKISIASGVTHTYTVTVRFKELNSAQDYNQGKTFRGTLNIAEGTKPPIKRAGTDSTTGLPVVRIGTEEFYDITNAINYSSMDATFKTKINYDASKSILLARYNLGKTTGVQTTSTTESDYAVPFSGSRDSNGYWYDSTTRTIKTKYGTYTNYANNIYDTYKITAPNYSVAFKNNAGNANYSIAYYVKEYIETLGIEATGRLLTYPEANAMTETQRANGQQYWLGSANTTYRVWVVLSYGNVTSDHFSDGSGWLRGGVRPVIVVSASDISA